MSGVAALPDDWFEPRHPVELWPHTPHPTQAAFLLLDDYLEAFYGGAAGGGKSDALLMSAVQYADFPHYRCLILRRTYPELSMPGAIMDRAKDWWQGSHAKWNGDEHSLTFKSGASITFAHAQYEDDVRRFGGTNFHMVIFDELTRFTENMYRFLFSRVRKDEGDPIPLRVRSASNPGDVGHDWVKRWFVHPGEPNRPFIPAKLSDNPSLNQEEYTKALMLLHPAERKRLLEGDWDVVDLGPYFRRVWFPIIEVLPGTFDRVVRYWDLAGTPPDGKNDPDWTAGCKMGRVGDHYYVLNMQRLRASSLSVEALVEQTALLDGRNCPIYIEQEPGQAGKAQIAYFKRRLPGFVVHGVPSSKDKATRAAPVASQAEARNVTLINGAWVGPFLDEIENFGNPKVHDDQVDALSGAFEQLAIQTPGRLVTW